MIAPVTPNRSELLMPAGSLNRLKTAVLYGADAIYCGTPDLSLRTQSDFTLEDVIEGVEFAHKHGKKVYLTLNLFAHNKDIVKLPKFIESIRKVKPDGVIVADPGVFQFVREHAPDLECHISTQANVCSWLTVNYWRDQGATLVVLARETSFQELEEIREKCPDTKLEAFVQGAMCMTYSGRCLLSNFMSERGANQGNCAHSCRWMYRLKVQLKDGSETTLEITDQNSDLFNFFLEEDFRPGEYLPIEEDMHGSYIMNSKDLCLMPKLDEYLRIGIDSLKVEGRNKSEYYVAVVTRAYRQAIDDYYKDPENWNPEPYLQELYTLQNRGFTMGFHEGKLTNLAHNYDKSFTLGGWQFAGVVRAWDEDEMIFEVRNTLEPGDVIEFLSPHQHEVIRLRVYEFIESEKRESLPKASPGQGRAIRIPVSAFHNEDPEVIKALLGPLSVGRKALPLPPDKQQALELDIRIQEFERGIITEEELQEFRDNPKSENLRQSLLSRAHKGKAPRLKDNGCCGLGCNGCLHFWHDDKYAAAREKMKKKKLGEKLHHSELKGL